MSWSEEEIRQGHRGAWACFIACEQDDLALADEILHEFGGTLNAGWPILAAQLRKALVEHAAKLGCDCGSDEWLEARRTKALGAS